MPIPVPSTYLSIQHNLEHHLAKILMDKSLRDFTPNDLIEYFLVAGLAVKAKKSLAQYLKQEDKFRDREAILLKIDETMNKRGA